MLKQKFKDFYERFKDEDAYIAQDSLAGLAGMINGLFLSLETEVKIDELPHKGLNDKGFEILEFFKDLTVKEAITMSNRLFDAINYERNKKVQDLKVSDLDITLL